MVIMGHTTPSTRPGASRGYILDKTHGEIRSFLDELSNGTSRYRSLHNLTEQVEHQYHGRFLLELIQNAHDALPPHDASPDERRIEVVLAPEEGAFGALYVANDGFPFTKSNFDALSNLGQSDKDPQKSIGNKGIGFRSVLEISRGPEIHSRSAVGSSGFDGFCFAFDPKVTERFERAIRALLKGDHRPPSPLDTDIPLVDWETRRLQDFQRRWQDAPDGWLPQELGLLSPYALPIPVGTRSVAPGVADFERRGLATVVRLPFDSAAARELASQAIDQLDGETILFLERVTVFRLASTGRDRLFRRKQNARPDDPVGGSEILIVPDPVDDAEQKDNEGRRYWMWTRRMGSDDDPEGTVRIRDAVADLPGKWPLVREATVDVAVPLVPEAEVGVLSIFLPTELPSGCSAHISASFFGDMSRTGVSFDQPLNGLLLKVAAETVADVVLDALVGKGEKEATAIVDLLAPRGEAGGHWWTAVTAAFEARGVAIGEADLLLHDSGWGGLTNVSLLPNTEEPSVLTPALLRSQATFDVCAGVLASRETLIEAIFTAAGISSEPSAEWLADTVERIASHVHAAEADPDWNGFWHDVQRLVKDGAVTLVGKKVLLGTDGELHASDDESSVFFRPQRVDLEDAEPVEEPVQAIPASLQPLVAFLHEDIETQARGPTGRRHPTALHGYLSQGLVSNFGVETILRNVLIPVRLEGLIPEGSDAETRCRDILQWGLVLVQNLLARDKGQGALPLLGRLPAPCAGGWYAIEKTTFGPGWQDTVGRDVETYLHGANTTESKEAARRLLLAPDHPSWRTLGSSVQEILTQAGATDGIRPLPIQSDDWSSVCWASKAEGFFLPTDPPPCFSRQIWELYGREVATGLRPFYKRRFDYRTQRLLGIPGLDRFESLDSVTLQALTRAVLGSLDAWAGLGDWAHARFRKIEGVTDSLESQSPLAFALERLPWLTVDGVDSFRPAERWFLAPTLKRSVHDYAHLRLLPEPIAKVLSSRDDLAPTLQSLGMPVHDGESSPRNPKLLDDLAAALSDPDVDVANPDVFLGQVRTAWRLLRPGERGGLPDKLIVRYGPREQTVVTPTSDEPVYLPDTSDTVLRGLELQRKPIVEIERLDAARLRDRFQVVFGDRIQLASELAVGPVVDGLPWTLTGSLSLSECGLEWMAPVVLTVFAYGGSQGRGTATQTFGSALRELKELRLAWVDRLEVGLWRGEERITSTPVPALVLDGPAIVADRQIQDRYGELADVLSDVVHRGDLPIPLRLVLGRLDRETEPSSGRIRSVLAELRISESHYNEVHQKWLGDLSWTIRMLRPLVLLLAANADLTSMLQCTSENELVVVLGGVNLEPLDAERAIRMARTATGFSTLGRDVHAAVGERASLKRWNDQLVQLEEPMVDNEDAAQQFREHLEAAQRWLRVIVCSLLRDDAALGGFHGLDAQIAELECPEDFASRLWSVGFRDTMGQVVDLLTQWRAPHEIVEAMRAATSPSDLRDCLSGLGLDPITDPIAIHAENHSRCERVAETVRKAGLAWCARAGVEPGRLATESAALPPSCVTRLDRDGFVDIWTEAECLEILGDVGGPENQRGFWEAVKAASTVDELLRKLTLSPNDLAIAHGQMDDWRRAQERKGRLVSVCGRDFDNREEKLGDLFDHIVREIEKDEISGLPVGDQKRLRDMSPGRRRPPKPRQGSGGTRPPGRISQAMKDLLGLAGEIHAYRALQKEYGSEIVGPHTWRSENSRHRFPGNTTNDGYGCDFVVRVDGKTHYIEVKATQGDQAGFELGPTEVRLALEKAHRRKETFHVLHVMDVLSREPVLRMLPNPFAPRHRAKYVFEDAGFRVRYQPD